MKNNEVDRVDRGIELIDSVLGIGKIAVLDLLAPELTAEEYDRLRRAAHGVLRCRGGERRQVRMPELQRRQSGAATVGQPVRQRAEQACTGTTTRCCLERAYRGCPDPAPEPGRRHRGMK